MFKRIKEVEELGRAAHGSVQVVIDSMRAVADDPDMSEGDVRDCLRKASTVLVSLNDGSAELQRHHSRLSRRFVVLTLLWGLFAGWHLYDVVWRAGWLPW